MMMMNEHVQVKYVIINQPVTNTVAQQVTHERTAHKPLQYHHLMSYLEKCYICKAAAFWNVSQCRLVEALLSPMAG